MQYPARFPVFLPEASKDGKDVSSVVAVETTATIVNLQQNECPLVLRMTATDPNGNVKERGEYRYRGGRFYRRTGIAAPKVGDRTFMDLVIPIGDFAHLAEWTAARAATAKHPLYPAGILDALTRAVPVSDEIKSHWDRSANFNLIDNEELRPRVMTASGEFHAACKKTIIVNGEIWPECPEPILGVNIGDAPGTVTLFAGPLTEYADEPKNLRLGKEWKTFPITEFEEAKLYAKSLFQNRASFQGIHPDNMVVTVLDRDVFNREKKQVRMVDIASYQRDIVDTKPADAGYFDEKVSRPDRSEPERKKTPEERAAYRAAVKAEHEAAIAAILEAARSRDHARQAAKRRSEKLAPDNEEVAAVKSVETPDKPEAEEADIYAVVTDERKLKRSSIKLALPRKLPSGEEVHVRSIRLRNDLDSADFQKLLAAAEPPLSTRLSFIASLYFGKDFAAAVEESKFNLETALFWVDIFNKEGDRGLSNSSFPTAADLYGGLDPQHVRKVASELVDGPNKRRLMAIASLYDGTEGWDVAKANSISSATLRAWVEVFNRADRYAFVQLPASKVEGSLKALASRKLVSSITLAQRFDAVSMTKQGANANEVFEATGANRAKLKSWITTYDTYGNKALSPDTVLTKSLTDPWIVSERHKARMRVRRNKKPIRIGDFDARAVEFAKSNSMEKLLEAADRAQGPIEAAIFKSLAARASGNIKGAKAPCVAQDEYMKSITMLESGGIPEVLKWFRATGLEMPWPKELRELARAQGNHPASGKLVAIAAHLEGKTQEEAAEINWMSPFWFGLTFGNFKRWGMASHMVFGINGPGRNYPVPRKPALASPMRVHDRLGKFRDRTTARFYITQVFGQDISFAVDRLEFLIKNALSPNQAMRLMALEKLFAAHTVEEVDAMSRNRKTRAIFDAFAEHGAAGLLDSEDELKRYALSPDRTPIATDMAIDECYEHQAAARALVEVARGAYPPEAAHANGVTVEQLESMVGTFDNYVAAYEAARKPVGYARTLGR